MDTRIIAEAPVRFLVSGMGDALATWFEAETCDRSNFRNISGGFNLRAIMSLAGLFLEARPQPLIDEIYAFCKSVGLPTTLAQVGLESVTDSEFDAAIQPVFDNKTSFLHNVGFDLTPDGIMEAIRMADAFGRHLG